MRLLSIPGLISICILFTHSGRFVLSTGSSRGSNQTSQSENKTQNPSGGSQSSQSQPKPTRTSGNPVTQTGSEQPVVLDLKNKQSCNEYEYSKDTAAKTETYTAKPGYKFSKVKNGNTDVWNPTDGKYATKVTLTTNDQGKLSLKVDIDQSTPTSPSGGQTGSNPVTPPSQSNSSSDTQVEDPDLKILTQGSDGSTKVNETSHFDLEIVGKFYKFEFKDEVKCTKVELNSVTLYEFGKTEPTDKHPKSMYVCDSRLLVFLEMDDVKFLLLALSPDNKLQSELLTGAKNLSESSIKIITKDGANSTKENDDSKYDFKKLDFAFEYKFKNNAECTEVKHNDKTVWKLDSANPTYPYFIYVLSSNVLVFPK